MSWYNDPPSNDPLHSGSPGGFTPPFAQDTSSATGQPPSANKHQTTIVVAVVGLLALVLGAGAFGAFLLLGGPEELSMSRYSSSLCKDVLKAHGKTLDKLTSDRDFERIWGDEVRSESKAKATLDAAQLVFAELQATATSLAEFNDSYVLRGSDGEEFRVDFADAIKDYKSDIDDFAKEMGELDPVDEEDAIEDLRDLWADLPRIDIDASPDEVGGELAAEILGDNDDCALAFASVINLEDFESDDSMGG